MIHETPDVVIRRLADEREIRDVLARYAHGIDRRDFEMVRDCYHADGIDRHPGFEGERDRYIEWVRTLLERYTVTMHFLGHTLFDVVGDQAAVETYAVAYHGGEPADDRWRNFAAGFRYVDRFERRAGRWRIADRYVVTDWVQPWRADPERLERLRSSTTGGSDPFRDVALEIGSSNLRHASAQSQAVKG